MMIEPLLGLLVILVVILVLYELLKQKPTRAYTQRLVDMYVAGRTRQLAKSKDINLDVEYTRFLMDEKKARLKIKSLGIILEEELSEELVKEFNKDKDKKAKE